MVRLLAQNSRKFIVHGVGRSRMNSTPIRSNKSLMNIFKKCERDSSCKKVDRQTLHAIHFTIYVSTKCISKPHTIHKVAQRICLCVSIVTDQYRFLSLLIRLYTMIYRGDRNHMHIRGFSLCIDPFFINRSVHGR